MMTSRSTSAQISGLDWMQAALEYSVDRWQRSILFWDVMRQRGNNYLEHLRNGQPPVLVFKYETIMDAMTFDPPVSL